MKNSITLHNTFAEAFPMKASRLIVTAYSKKWALEAANSFTGLTSVVGLKRNRSILEDTRW